MPYTPKEAELLRERFIKSLLDWGIDHHLIPTIADIAELWVNLAREQMRQECLAVIPDNWWEYHMVWSRETREAINSIK